MFTLHNGDCLEGLQELQPESVDMIITDPPYSTPVVTAFGRKKVKNLGDLSLQEYYFRSLKTEFERILKPDGRVFIFCDDKYYPILFGVFYEWQSQSLIVWDKGKIGMGNPIRKQHELIAYCNRTEYEYNRTEGITHYPSILKYKPVPTSERVHGAQKPVELVRDLILGFSNSGDVILDCFMGSGTSGVASKITGRSFIGYEINAEFYSIAEKRISEAVLEQRYLTPSNNRLHMDAGDSPRLPSQSTLEGFTPAEQGATPAPRQ